MTVMSKKFFIISGILFAAVSLLVLLLFFRSDTVPAIRLETHASVPGGADSDGDGVPDWLEEVTDSDSLRADSFPYNRDIIRARENTENSLLYASPGEFTEQIIQRFLLDIDGSASVTDEEKDRFVNESVEYFLDLVEKRGLPKISLTADDTVSRKEVLQRFVAATRRFSDAEKPIDILVFEVFSNQPAAIQSARETKESCNYVLRMLPQKVPRNILTPYRLILERITYLCEAVTVSLSSATADNFFYAVRLVSAGELYENSSNSDTTETNGFVEAINEIIHLLEQ